VSRPALEIWTIFDHPKDFPDYFVARLTNVTSAGPEVTEMVLHSADLEELRGIMMRQGLTRIPRFKDDSPQIVEVWL